MMASSAPPLAPLPPTITSVTSASATVSWLAPESHGSPVHEYKLFYGADISRLTAYYTGELLRVQVKGLAPATTYIFRVQVIDLCHGHF